VPAATISGVASGKRHLTVLKEPAAEEGEPRPPWQWVGFGALGIFVVWLPLSWAATSLAFTLDAAGEAPVARAALFSVSLAIASVAGGYLVGRWGTRGIGLREAALAGLAAGAGATALAWGTAGFFPEALVTVMLATPMAALGGKVGLKRRS
jgi:hypothetical protein